MANDTRAIKATCLCTAAAHEITLPASAFPFKAIFCHCSSDRHSTGSLCLGIAVLPPEYKAPGAWLEKLQSTEFSKRITHYFCPTCGTMMLARLGGGDGGARWDVCTGALEQIDGVVEVDCHEYIADTVDGGFSDFLQRVDGKQVGRWSGEPGQGEQLPLYWQSSSRPTIQPSPSDKLHAYCRCKGVEFWISRPSKRSAMGKAAWPDVLHPFDSPAPKPKDAVWWLRAGGTKYLAGCCSCDSCRLATGQEWIEWAFVPAVDITLDEAGQVPFSREFGMLKHYRSSEVATRHFCGGCGATVFWDGDERPQLLDIAVGLLDAPEGARAESWLEWRTARLSYREDALPRAKGVTEGVEEGLRGYGKRYQREPQDAAL
ncbi:hypothetical protein B0A55_06293 [Friedmanniomyces simplex]|uniref:CENP-V/GFA domain-containing protein n=1 Tax=Friedmanniomyces simplex TaxID=329884 RepID=A0A4U0XFU8_9PEZI|nr:hypothetical protein B0A55_06293 [Friedmanniomyces simplex]